jgi:hypothetical protein
VLASILLAAAGSVLKLRETRFDAAERIEEGSIYVFRLSEGVRLR